jgi:hypothetical protein
MAAAGKPVDNLDVISHILLVLDEEYDGFVAAITALTKVEKNVSLSDVYSQFMSYEAHMESRKASDGSSVNTSTHGGRGGGRGDHQDQYHEHQYDYDQCSGYGGGYDCRTMVVVMADMVVAVAMADKTLREIAITMVAMVAAPMTLVKYVVRFDILH